jgi:hypothetical protein
LSEISCTHPQKNGKKQFIVFPFFPTKTTSSLVPSPYDGHLLPKNDEPGEPVLPSGQCEEARGKTQRPHETNDVDGAW